MRIALVVIVVGMGLPSAAFAQNRDMFNGLDAWELTRGLEYQTTCEIESPYRVEGQSFCFSSLESLSRFGQNLQGNVARAKTVQARMLRTFDSQDARPDVEQALRLQRNTLYATGYPGYPVGRLFVEYASTGLFRLVGPMSHKQVTDVAFKGSSLYGMTFTDFLRVSASTGASTVIRDIGVRMDDMNALAYRPQSGLFYAAGVGGMVITIDPATGRGRRIGAYGSGMGSSGDLAVNARGVIFATVKRSGTANDFLATVNPRTGRATIRGNIGFRHVYGLTFKDGILYGGTWEGMIIRINTSTGVGRPAAYSQIAHGGLTTSP
jgi:hypothetical protein